MKSRGMNQVIPLVNSSCRQRRLSLPLLSALLALGNLAPTAVRGEAAGNGQHLTAAIPRDFPPHYQLEGDQPDGFAIDVMDRVASRAGITVSYLVLDSWTEVFSALAEGRADLIPNAGVTTDREVHFDFTAPVETFPVSVFVRQTTWDIEGVSSLPGHKVAVVKSNVAAAILANRPGVDLEVFDGPSDALFELLAGQVEALVYPQPVLLQIARDIGVEERISVVGEPLVEVKRGIAVRKDRQELLAALDAAVQDLVGTPEYQRIYTKWYGQPKPFWNPARVVWLAGALVVLGLAGAFSARYLALARLNRQLARSIEEREAAEESLRQRAQEMDALHSLGSQVSLNLDLDQVVKAALDGITGAVRPDLALLFLREGENLVLKGAGPHNAGLSHGETPVHRVGECLCGLAVRTGEPQYAIDIHQDSRCSWQECKNAGVRSFAALPLRSGDELIGVVGLAMAKERDFGAQAPFLETLANEVAIGVQNALLYEEARRHRDELEQRVKERTEDLEAFSYSISHDLRTPLRTMQGFAQALAEDCGHQLDSTGQDYVRRLERSAKRMDAQIRDLLAYSRLARTEVQLGPVSLEPVVREVLQEMEIEIRETGAQIDVARPLPTVIGQQVVMVQVLSNLVANGIKFMAPGTRPELRIRCEEGDGTIRVWVEDNGIGIAAEYWDRIFQVFERLHGADKFPGTGTGLAIVRKGVERMGGRVGVESEPGTGSKFWVELVKAAE